MEQLNQRITRLITFYESRRIRNSALGNLEPSWALVPFTCLFRWKEGEPSEEDLRDTKTAINALEMSGVHHGRLYEDGFTFGTVSWVFMGRCLPDSEIIPCGNDVVIVGRRVSKSTITTLRELRCELPVTTLWIAYSRSVPFHIRGVGPCKSVDEVRDLIPLEFED